MDFVRVIQEVITGKGVIHAGEVFLVNHRLGGWKIVGGRFDGYFLQDREIEFIPEFFQMKQELLQLRKEVVELRTKLEQRKPGLSREVAEALEAARKWASGKSELVAWCIPIEEEEEADYWRVLRFYSRENPEGFFDLIDALRYGYIIEDPHAEKRMRLLENLAKIGYEGESARIIVDTIAPIIFAESEKNG